MKSKVNKSADRVSSIEDAIRMMERISGAAKDGGKGILQSFIELEEKVKGYCEETFTLKAEFTALLKRFDDGGGGGSGGSSKKIEQQLDLLGKRMLKHDKDF